MMSVGETMAARLRWEKTSPGWQPRMVVSGMRESEQPSQRMEGVSPIDWEVKKVGFWWDL